ncbi:hypothetical protein T440DRAFT_516669 [Plenodomus tracheiphilus IPT5]|uniref:Uncharacterized protein n=1 Tax=Plenodomus tracheiphilus IPT5 TaxID=1408161 RepID=A0A6A7B9S4_9PLEO|nr:hypothetical protein T440DRAFT_516669 [Plenodomus tracheiphilus IPT5]
MPSQHRRLSHSQLHAHSSPYAPPDIHHDAFESHSQSKKTSRTRDIGTSDTPSRSPILESVIIDDEPESDRNPLPTQETQEDATTEDWQIHTPTSTSLPSYSFPGTWPTALHDTRTALASVTMASASYASALSRSGLGRAGRSIGSALLATTNKRALSMASWAVERSGVMMGELPGPVRGWLEGKKRADEARRLSGSGIGMEAQMEDERGSFIVTTREVDGRGEFVDGPRAEGDSAVLEEDDEGWVGGEDEDDGFLRAFEYDE